VNNIQKSPLKNLGYHFIPEEYLPNNKSEYYLRNQQNKNGIAYRQLTAYEIEVLVRNRNTSDDWNKILVSDLFMPELVQNCKFYGLVRIGKLEAIYAEFHNLRRPIGLYNSTIISCDIGHNVVVDNCHYLSHYIIGNEVMIVNVNELATTNYAKFGNGIVKEGEEEKNRIVLEVCNENGGRSIVPFSGMLPGDAYLWSRYRDNTLLQQKLKHFTDQQFDNHRGYYGQIGDRTIIKNTRIIKDVWMGTDVYIKGANKLKNLTIQSSAAAKSQIGEGCELVNGIVAEGCRIFYGVKAVRFVMASNSQLKYGARLINSYLGNNATISCCEVLNSLIFPAHEQHHNNSFLCASLIMGQSNMAAGATIGSNHNSRSADGELVAGRGFWPGLCVSLKHNSTFASFTLLTKGDYPAELHVPFPFSLVSNDVAKNQLTILPGYWFLYNMYALARNAHKYEKRDNRVDKIQYIEYHFLAPDSIDEIIKSIELFEVLVGNAYVLAKKKKLTAAAILQLGKQLLNTEDPIVEQLEIIAPHVENSGRKVVIKKIQPCYLLFKNLIVHYVAEQLVYLFDKLKIKDFESFKLAIGSIVKTAAFTNVGGQLIPTPSLEKMLQRICKGSIKNWAEVHHFYQQQGAAYPTQKLQHSVAALQAIHGINIKKTPALLKEILQKSVAIKKEMLEGIKNSRAKDYQNEYRKMSYANPVEMNAVLGSLEENEFIALEEASFKSYKKKVSSIIKKLAEAE
jgi:hypothetical protein